MRPLRRIYLHIGLHKTGTTAIQQALFSSRCALRSLGFLYPESIAWHDCSHHALLLPLWHGEDWKRPFDRLEAEVRAAKPESLILSSELMADLMSAPMRAAALLERLAALTEEIEVILFLRRQDRLAASVFKQWCKSRERQLSALPGRFLRKPRSINLDFLACCRAWANNTHVQRLHLRSYERCGGNAVPAFLEVLGLPVEAVGAHKDVRANASLDGAQLMFRHYLNRRFEQDPHGDRLLEYLLAKVPATPRLDIFTTAQRRALLTEHAEQNLVAFREYGDGSVPFDDALDVTGNPFRHPTAPELETFATELSSWDPALGAELVRRLELRL